MIDRRTPLAKADPTVFQLIRREVERQEHGLELIASENFVSVAVLEAMGSALTNKYAEGLPRKRYYGGCEVVDEVEQLAIDRAKALFKAEHANVQPHSGAQANMAAYLAVAKPGDTLLGLALSHGGHLTHGAPVNFSGTLFRAVHYGVREDTGRIDYDQGRTPRGRHRGEGGRAGRGAHPGVQAVRAAGGEERPGPRRGARGPGLRDRLGRHRHAPDARGPAPQERHREGGAGAARPGVDHRQQEHHPRRPAEGV